jgi:DNA-binding NarL/FixJ family response regulator
MMIRLLIADDHSILRKGLKNILEREANITVTGEAASGAEVLLLISGDEFDLLLLDMTMEGLSGPELIKRVKEIRPALPILVLSMHKASSLAIHALRAGAAGYITKDSDPELLLEAIQKVAGGKKYIDHTLAEEIAYNTTSSGSGLSEQLSSREFEVFRLLIAGRNIKEIAQQLNLSGKTVSTYKTRIMEKLNISNMADLIRYAMQHNITS